MSGTVSVFARLKAERIAKGMTQAQVANVLVCSQSAISKFEGGRLDALSNDKILQLAKLLGVDVDLTPASKELSFPQAPARIVKFCASVWCPSCDPYRVENELCLRPTFLVCAADEDRNYCGLCGEPLQDRCPRCQKPAVADAFCRHCGAAYVPVDQTMADEIVSKRRAGGVEAEALQEASRRVIGLRSGKPQGSGDA